MLTCVKNTCSILVWFKTACVMIFVKRRWVAISFGIIVGMCGI